MYLQSDRSFQVWAYSVSHGQLLIRSPKSEATPENIDLAFVGAADIRVSTNGFDYRETDLDFLAFLKPGQRIVEDSNGK
jgi:hypothetical protein